MQYEKILNQMIRRERYLHERDRRHKLLYSVSDTDLYRLSPDLYSTEKEQDSRETMKKAVCMAMSDLKQTNLNWYQLMIEYYLGEEKVSMRKLGLQYGISHQAISKKLKKAKNLLKKYIAYHFEMLNVKSPLAA